MKKKLLIPILLMIPIFSLFLFSLLKIINWNIDNKATNLMMHEIEENREKKDFTNSKNEIESTDNNSIIDFEKLKKMNDEVVGWIEIPNTRIDYPIVRHSDNSFYLTHSFNKKKNQAGWIFLDYRSDMSKNEKNTIIYGHNRLDESMFGTLKNLTKEDYLKNNEHYIYVETPDANYKYEIFSIYRIDTTDDYIKTNFSDEELSSWLNVLKNRSIYNFNVAISKEDNILTLSTCSNKNKKLVVHAKLLLNKN